MHWNWTSGLAGIPTPIYQNTVNTLQRGAWLDEQKIFVAAPVIASLNPDALVMCSYVNDSAYVFSELHSSQSAALLKVCGNIQCFRAYFSSLTSNCPALDCC